MYNMANRVYITYSNNVSLCRNPSHEFFFTSSFPRRIEHRFLQIIRSAKISTRTLPQLHIISALLPSRGGSFRSHSFSVCSWANSERGNFGSKTEGQFQPSVQK